jgi:hypothetical protein
VIIDNKLNVFFIKGRKRLQKEVVFKNQIERKKAQNSDEICAF